MDIGNSKNYLGINRIYQWYYWGCLSVILVLLHSPRLQHPKESNHRPFLFTLIGVQYPATIIQYTLFTMFICSVGRIRFASFQIPSGRISWLKNCLVRLVHLAISADVATNWSICSWSGNIGNVRICKWCTTASICCVDDVNTRTVFLVRWGFPTEAGNEMKRST